jgi:hypothetical protein
MRLNADQSAQTTMLSSRKPLMRFVFHPSFVPSTVNGAELPSTKDDTCWQFKERSRKHGRTEAPPSRGPKRVKFAVAAASSMPTKTAASDIVPSRRTTSKEEAKEDLVAATQQKLVISDPGELPVGRNGSFPKKIYHKMGLARVRN